MLVRQMQINMVNRARISWVSIPRGREKPSKTVGSADGLVNRDKRENLSLVDNLPTACCSGACSMSVSNQGRLVPQMQNYLAERLHELRTRYKQTGDSKWLHRYNECRHIFERLILDEINGPQSTRRSEGRHTTQPSPGYTSTDSHRRLA